MTQKPIKATLDNSDDSVKTQKPILIQLDDIPTPEVGDAGKVLGVDDEGKYALVEGSSKLYQHLIALNSGNYGVVTIINDDPTIFTKDMLVEWLNTNGFTTDNNLFADNITSYITVNTPNTNEFKFMRQMGIYTDGTNLRAYFERYTVTYSNNVFSGNKSHEISIFSAINDTVLQIQ